MAKPKGDAIISKGAETHVKNWLKEQQTGKKKVIVSKYTSKGNIAEPDAIKMLSEYLDFGILCKNHEVFYNTYISGEPDIILKKDGITIDVKASWDIDTFPMYETCLPNIDYYWQGQGYMDLTGCKKHIVAYVLVNTPTHLIESDSRRYCFMNGISDTICETDINILFEKNMTYDDVPMDLRIKLFEFDYDPDAVSDICLRVEGCRGYIHKLLNESKHGKEIVHVPFRGQKG